MASFKWPSVGGGSGTVTSVAFADGSSVPIFSISGSPIIDSGTIIETLVTQQANRFFAGPGTGSAVQPAFRSILAADIFGLFGDLTDVGTDGIIVTGGTASVLGSGVSLAQHVADTTHNGYLASADWVTFNSKQAAGSYITALTGDGTASGPGFVALTFATVNSNIGSFGSASSVGGFTVNAKGLVTAASSTAIQIAESQVTNLTSDLAGKVTAVSVASANGLAGSSSGGATPSLTLSTTITGVLKGNGTAISAANVTDIPSKTQSYELSNLGLSMSISSNQLVIALKQADGSTDPTSTSPVVIGFRDATATSGDYSSISVTSAVSLTLGTAASLGGTTATSYNFFVYALNNSGAAELFASLTPFWDQGIPQNTSTTATSNAVLFGANARTGKAIRLIGRGTATWTSGTGWSAITNVSVTPFSLPEIEAWYYTSTSTITGSFAKVTYATKFEDDYNAYISGTFTAPSAGKYQVDAGISITTTVIAGQGNQISIYKNGTETKTNTVYASVAATVALDSHVGGCYKLVAGDTIEIFALSQGSALSVNSSTSRNYVSITRVGD